MLGARLEGLSKVIRARYENGVLKPLEPLELEEGEELLVKIIRIERRREILRKYRGILGSAPKELLDMFMLEAEEQ
jgi:predicted DNA-binding antitoxin AbrB/MazE fold protein